MGLTNYLLYRLIESDDWNSHGLHAPRDIRAMLIIAAERNVYSSRQKSLDKLNALNTEADIANSTYFFLRRFFIAQSFSMFVYLRDYN